MNNVVKGKPGPKRASNRVNDEAELLEIMQARNSGMSWRKICKAYGLKNDQGMTARNLYLRGLRRGLSA